jgi:hypothetical protein
MRLRTVFHSQLAFLILAAPLAADEIMRLQVDLDGDGRAESVRLETRPTTEEGTLRAVVKVGNATYQTEFFNDGVEAPAIEAFRIDPERQGSELLLTTYDPCCCNYHLLAYRQGRLLRLRSDQQHSCKRPETLGEGTLAIRFWDGFWVRADHYRLTPDGLGLTPVNRIQWVNVGIAAGKDLVLESPECPARAVPEDQYVWIKEFDPATNRYRLESANGGCGWLPAAELDSPKLKHIRWAG